jgi:hypothetical protein
MFKVHGLQVYILHNKNQLHVPYIITNTSSEHVLQLYTVLCLLSIPYLLKFFHNSEQHLSSGCTQNTILGYNGLQPNNFGKVIENVTNFTWLLLLQIVAQGTLKSADTKHSPA